MRNLELLNRYDKVTHEIFAKLSEELTKLPALPNLKLEIGA